MEPRTHLACPTQIAVDSQEFASLIPATFDHLTSVHTHNHSYLGVGALVRLNDLVAQLVHKLAEHLVLWD